jgi:transcriptional regulator with XRE-family HTH domain
MKLKDLLKVYGITQAQLAELLGQTEASISRKMAGLRPWKVSEANIVLVYLQDHGDRHLTLGDLF